MRFLTSLGGAAALGLVLSSQAFALDEIKFATNWLAQAEHGGFYQAVADGTYEKYGLKVEIVQGGPQAASRALMLAGKVEFYMAGNMLQPLNALAEDIPVVEVAAIFQKDPQVLITHPDAGLEKFEDLAKLPTIFMGTDGFASFFQWMKSAYPGFKDEQYKPYAFNPARSWPTSSRRSRAISPPSPSPSRRKAASSRNCSCWRIMASRPIPPSSRGARITSRPTRT